MHIKSEEDWIIAMEAASMVGEWQAGKYGGRMASGLCTKCKYVDNTSNISMLFINSYGRVALEPLLRVLLHDLSEHAFP